MDKKPSNVNFVIRLTVILAFFAVILFPMCLMGLDGPEKPDANMQEDTIKLVAPTPENYFSGKFQSTFETWLSQYYPLRSSIVSGYRDIKIEVENSKPVLSIMNALKGNTLGNGPENPGCTMHADDDFNGICDVCGEKLYDVPDVPGDEPGDNPGDDPSDEPGDDPVGPKPPVNVYLDPSNIYAKINRLQMLQTAIEPQGFTGANDVWIGKSGYLYEASYINEYMGYTDPYISVTDKGLQETVDKLEYIQKELEKRGITMLYVISSSKASAYPDYIPEYYKNSHTAKPGYVRPIERIRPMLEASDINYLDSAKYYEEIGLLVTFPKTGIHWNALASFESTAKLIRMYSELTGRETVELTARGVLTIDGNCRDDQLSSFNHERDVFNKLYNAAPNQKDKAIKDAAYYFPDIAITNKGAPKLNVLVQGGSFTHSIVHYINACGVGNATQIYYKEFHRNSPWTEGPEAWEYWLEGRDLVIFEATEQQIRGGHKTDDMSWYETAVDHGDHIGHNAIYDSLYEYLKAHEGEY
jgi:hypothetical protein